LREHKTLRFKTEEYDEEQGIFKGRAAVFGNIDSGDDIIEPGAFTKTLKDWSRVKLLALHNDQWLPIGRPVELREEKKDLYIEGKISDTSMGKDVKILIRDGVLNELSIGYDVAEDGFYYEGEVRHLTELILWEVSVVTWAMNAKAMITGYKDAAFVASSADAIAKGVAGAHWSGQQLTAAGLKHLAAARDSMLTASQAIDSVIRAEQESKKQSRPALFVPRRGLKRKHSQVEIVIGGKQK